ncbi:MAG: hypothetical protein P8P32_16575 [Akkermansiaceae bacterium]|nr:hypothetical protein [Akkermansiaceae bacterium]MDG2322918.1 hypothetical protein [Akkermansiaceae bacterium]
MKLLLLVGLMTGSLWAGGSRVLLVSPPVLKEAWQEDAREHIEKHRYHTIILGGDSSPKGGLIPDRNTFHQNQWGKDVADARKSATYHQGICEINLLGDPTLQVK